MVETRVLALGDYVRATGRGIYKITAIDAVVGASDGARMLTLRHVGTGEQRYSWSDTVELTAYEPEETYHGP